MTDDRVMTVEAFVNKNDTVLDLKLTQHSSPADVDRATQKIVDLAKNYKIELDGDKKAARKYCARFVASMKEAAGGRPCIFVGMRELVDNGSLISHIVLGGFEKAVLEQIWHDAGERARTAAEPRNVKVEVLVDGHPCDVRDFIDSWQSQVKRMIDSAAAELVREQFGQLDDKLREIGDKLNQFKRDNIYNTLGIKDDDD